jgi:type IV secretion system protein VirB2
MKKFAKLFDRTRVIASAIVGLLSSAAPAFAQAAAQTPQGAGPILNAVTWVQDTLMGNVATTVAVIAIATVGFMMLSGRLNWRYGATVIIGCFILFGAATIVGGIRAVSGG